MRTPDAQSTNRESLAIDCPGIVAAEARLIHCVLDRLLGNLVQFVGIIEEGGKIHFGYRRVHDGPMVIFSRWDHGWTLSGMRGSAADAIMNTLEDILQSERATHSPE